MEPEAFAERGDGGSQAAAERPARAEGLHPDRPLFRRGVRRAEQPVIVRGGVRREDRAVESQSLAAARQDEQLAVRRAGIPIEADNGKRHGQARKVRRKWKDGHRQEPLPYAILYRNL